MVVTLPHSLFNRRYIHETPTIKQARHYLTLKVCFHNSIAEEKILLSHISWSCCNGRKYKLTMHLCDLQPSQKHSYFLGNKHGKKSLPPITDDSCECTSQAVVGQLLVLTRLFKQEAGGQQAALLSASTQICMYSHFHNHASSQCLFSKLSDLHVRSSSYFLGELNCFIQLSGVLLFV